MESNSSKTESLYENIIGKNLTITDNFYQLKGDYVNDKRFFEFNEYKILNDVNDAQTNNLSNIILSSKAKASDIISTNFSKIENNKLDDFTQTTLCFGYESRNINNALFIGVGKNNDVKVTHGQHEDYFYIFNIEKKSENTCEIYYFYDNKQYYFTINENKSLSVTDNYENRKKFAYHLYNNLINLYLIEDSTVPYILSCVGDTAQFKSFDETDEYHSFYENIYIERSPLANYTIDSAWVTYEQNNDINQINNERSHFSLENQFILHHEYATSGNANIIPLKNNFTYKNEVSNGESSKYNPNKEYLRNVPMDFKNYVSLSTGNNQEYGYDNIILNFTFNEQSYTINPGDDLIFSIPENNNDSFELSALYPYKQININDAPFIRNGAFGSDSPALSDKIKYYSKTTDPNNKGESVRYLCSWLWYDEERKESVWLDRYYYPVITKEVAENKLCNLVDGYIKNDENFKNNLVQYTIYDRRSDITIKEGGTYKYSRISDEDVANVFNSLKDSRIENRTSNRGSINSTYDEILLDGSSWYKLQDDKLSNTNTIHFNADIYLNPEKKMGIQLFGCDMTHGFNIQNRKDLTPLYYYADENSVYLYNNSNILCKSLNLYDIYNEKIQKVIGDVAFKNLFVILENSIVILHYDLSIKIHCDFNSINSLYKINYKDAIYYTLYESNLYIVSDTHQVYRLKYTIEQNNSLSIDTDFTTIKHFDEKKFSINSIYFDETTNIIHCFKEKRCKIAADKNTIFTIDNSLKNEETDDFKYAINAYKLSLSGNDGTCYFKSKTSFDNMAVGPNDELLLVRGFDDNDSSKRCFEVYDKARNRIYRHLLSSYDDIKSVVFYRYIDTGGIEHMTFKLMCSRNEFVDILLYHINEQHVTTTMTNLVANDKCDFICNDNNIIKYSNENALYFNLYAFDMPITKLRWDISSIQTGWYNIDALINLDKKLFVIKVNDVIISDNLVTYFNSIKDMDSNSFFDNVYTIGSVSKSHGLGLNELLYNGKADPYAVNNTKLKNLTLYNRKLNYFEQQASLLYFKKINPLILTLPCGIRNGMEEIVRYFKYNKPGNISNKLKINISGLNDINLKRDSEILKSQILNTIQNETDCLLEVEDIEFI